MNILYESDLLTKSTKLKGMLEIVKINWGSIVRTLNSSERSRASNIYSEGQKKNEDQI